MRRLPLIGGAVGVAALAVVFGLGIGNPPVDRYRAVEGDTLDRLPARCMLAIVGIRCMPARFYLDGIDALETDQTCTNAQGASWPCGKAALARLTQLAQRPDFRCLIDDAAPDRRARSFGACLVGDQDVASILVAEGLAFAVGRRTRYVEVESEAKRLGTGAWGGSFVRPQYYRFLAAAGRSS